MAKLNRKYIDKHWIVFIIRGILAGVFGFLLLFSNVAEVENLYLLEPLLRLVADHLALNPDDISAKVKDFVFKEFANEQASQLKELCSRQIAFILQQFDKPKGDSPQDLKDAITATVSKIDVDKIYAENKMLIDDILSKSDYQRLLFIYNRKSLSTRVSTFFGLANNKYPSLVLNLLKTKKREEI